MPEDVVRMIDPPNGHAFGFPKPFDGDENDVVTWLLANGYPQAQIDLYPGGVPCRIIWLSRRTTRSPGKVA